MPAAHPQGSACPGQSQCCAQKLPAPALPPTGREVRGPPLSWYVVGPGWQAGGLGPLSAHLLPWCGQNQEPATGPLGLLQGRLLKACPSSSCTSPRLPREGTGQGSTWEQEPASQALKAAARGLQWPTLVSGPSQGQMSTSSPKGLVHDPGFNWLPCDWASVSLSVMRGAGRGNCSCLVTGSDHP